MSGILLAHRHAGAKTGIVLPNIGDAFMGGFFAGIIDTTKGNIIIADYFQTGQRFAVIVAPKSLETNSIAYKTTADAAPPQSSTRWNGQGATTAMNSASYPAAQYCAGLDYPSDGGSPWYLPAMDELELIYRNLKPTTDANYTTSDTGSTFPGGTVDMGYNPSSDPEGQRYIAGNPAQTSVVVFKASGAQVMVGSFYWSATEYAASTAWRQYFSHASVAGRQYPLTKTSANSDTYVRPVRRLVLA